MYIFFSAQSKKGCHVANGKPLCGASPGEDWPYYWRSSTGWACCCMFKQSVSKKRFPCTDRDFIVMQIRSAENKAQVKWLTAKCYPYFIHNCSLETIKNANIAFFLVSSFWCEEWYLEKCGSRKILARSRISELAFDGSQVSFSGDFCVSPVPIFVIVVVVVVVFADGSWSRGFVVFSFRLVFRRRIFQSLWVQRIELKAVYWWAYLASFH